jgi:hypothetical protein
MTVQAWPHQTASAPACVSRDWQDAALPPRLLLRRDTSVAIAAVVGACR